MTFQPGFDEEVPPNIDATVSSGPVSRYEWHERAAGRVPDADPGGRLPPLPPAEAPELIAECDREGLSWTARMARLTRRMCEAETVVIEPDERIVFTRTLPAVPPVYSRGRLATADRRPDAARGRPHQQHLRGLGHGPRPGAAGAPAGGARDPSPRDGRRATPRRSSSATRRSRPSTRCSPSPSATRRQARRRGHGRGGGDARAGPGPAARTFHEALQSLRLLQAVVWLSGHYHVGLGRFDQYLWPYLEADLEAGRLDEAEAEELLAEFFIALNQDSDLYPGIQQGDNGQSLTLGRRATRRRLDAVNPLTWMALRVACDVGLIDPKINLRIGADTDLELLELATELTRKGLGFPQYSNDDVVIPALVAHGYDLEDARDYTVAACWEFIIPGRGMEVVNIGAVSFPPRPTRRSARAWPPVTRSSASSSGPRTRSPGRSASGPSPTTACSGRRRPTTRC